MGESHQEMELEATVWAATLEEAGLPKQGLRGPLPAKRFTEELGPGCPLRRFGLEQARQRGEAPEDEAGSRKEAFFESKVRLIGGGSENGQSATVALPEKVDMGGRGELIANTNEGRKGRKESETTHRAHPLNRGGGSGRGHLGRNHRLSFVHTAPRLLASL